MNNRMTRGADSQPESAAEQVAMLTHSLHVSRFTVVCGPRGVGKSQLAQAALFGQSGSAQPSASGNTEIAILFGQWSGDPTAALRKAIIDAVDARTNDPVTRPGLGRRSLADTLEYWSERADARFIIVLDHFERNLEAEPMRSENASFTDELAVALNRPSLKANFLIVINDDSEGLLSRLTLRLGRLYDSFLRVSAPATEKAPEPRLNTTASRDTGPAAAATSAAASIPRPTAPPPPGGSAASAPRADAAAAAAAATGTARTASAPDPTSRPSAQPKAADARREPRIDPAFFGRMDNAQSMVTPQRFRAAEHIELKRARRRRGWSTAGIALAGLATIALPVAYLLYRATMNEPARYSALLDSAPSSFGISAARRAIDAATSDDTPQGDRPASNAGGSATPDAVTIPAPGSAAPAATPQAVPSAPVDTAAQTAPREETPPTPEVHTAAPAQAATAPTPVLQAAPALQTAPAQQAASAAPPTPTAPSAVTPPPAPTTTAPTQGATPAQATPPAQVATPPAQAAAPSLPAPSAAPPQATATLPALPASQSTTPPAPAATSRAGKAVTPAAPSAFGNEKPRPATRTTMAAASPEFQEGATAPFGRSQRDAAAAATAALNIAAVRDLNLARIDGTPSTKPVAAQDLKPVPAGRAKVQINIRSEGQRAYANMLAQKLEHSGITVSGIAKVDRGPDWLDLRYYHPNERDEALSVQAALQREGVPAAQPRLIGGYEESAAPRNYELWLAPERN